MRKDSYYLAQFRKSYTLKDLFYYISFLAWERLELYSRLSSKIGEEEITNTLVSEILSALCQENAQLPIRLFHAKDETANGNDLEIVLPIDNNRCIIMPCQAKRLYVEKVNNNLKAKYTAIHHLVNKKTLDEKEQIRCLLEYAHKWGGFPLYLFYNYSEHEVEINVEYPKKQLYGCTIASAYHVFEGYYNAFNEKISPFTFQDIHPPAKPLLSLLDKRLLPELKTFLGASISFNKLKAYKDADLLEQNWWDEKCPPLSVPIQRRSASQSLEQILKNNYSNTKEEYPFNPKYRIMILREPDIHREINIKP